MGFCDNAYCLLCHGARYKPGSSINWILNLHKIGVINVHEFDFFTICIFQNKKQQHCIDLYTAKIDNLNFHSLEVVSRHRDPQLQVGENYLY